ncbi:uncharacterized protein LOC135483458 [Lineus longissimus]|uniref:uncharacterized protein LOC135483458 n=1 Tax=Lineus longissimus TaxID=88925 RepID=UPI002B4E514D
MGQGLEKPIERERIILLGSYAGGKTSILHWLMHGEFKEQLELGPWVDQDEEVTYKGMSVFHPGVDAGGRSLTRPFLPQYFRSALAMVYVIDASRDGLDMDYTQYELSEARKEPTLNDAVIVAIANKLDIPGAKTMEEIEELINAGEERKIKIFPAAACKGEGVNECFDWLIDEITKQHLTKPVTEPWADVAKDVTKDGKAGLNKAKGTWKKLVARFCRPSSRTN